VVLITVFAIAALIALLLRFIAGSVVYRFLLGPAAGALALLALPGCYLCVLRLTWNWRMQPGWPGPAEFWGSSTFLIFCGEVLGLGILWAFYRKRSMSLRFLSVLLLAHYAFWVSILWPDITISLYRVYAPFVFIAVFTISGIVWLAYLKATREQPAETTNRARTDMMWSIGCALLGSAIFLLVWMPARGKSIADPKDMDSVTIEMSRGPCFGPCPSYTIRIRGNGRVEYVGGRHSKPGSQVGSVTSEQVGNILRALDETHFSALDDRAFSWCFDTPSVAVSVFMDGTTKRVVSDESCVGAKSGLQAQFVRVTNEIDRVVGSDQWVKCEGPCRN
jgi:hypothetical protein